MVELIDSIEKKYKVLMKEKISLIVIEREGHVVKCRKIKNKRGIVVKFLRSEGAEKMVGDVGRLVDGAKRGEIRFLGECLEIWDEDLKWINSGK